MADGIIDKPSPNPERGLRNLDPADLPAIAAPRGFPTARLHRRVPEIVAALIVLGLDLVDDVLHPHRGAGIPLEDQLGPKQPIAVRTHPGIDLDAARGLDNIAADGGGDDEGTADDDDPDDHSDEGHPGPGNPLGVPLAADEEVAGPDDKDHRQGNPNRCNNPGNPIDNIDYVFHGESIP